MRLVSCLLRHRADFTSRPRRSYDNIVWDVASTTASATIGFNANDGVQSFSLPGSFSSPADKLLSCGGRGGCYTYRVDGSFVIDSSGSPTRSFSSSTTPSYSRSPSQASTRLGSSSAPMPSTLTSSASYSPSSLSPSETSTQVKTPSGSPSPTPTPSGTLSQTESPRTLSQSPSQLPSFVGLSPDAYSGSGGARDPCSHGLRTLYPFGAVANDNSSAKGDDFSFSMVWDGAPFVFLGQPFNAIFPSTNGVRRRLWGPRLNQ